MDKAAPSQTNGKGSVGGDRTPRTNASPDLGEGEGHASLLGIGAGVAVWREYRENGERDAED